MSVHPRRRQAGQISTGYGFVVVVMAVLTIGVVVLAGDQLRTSYADINYDIGHLGDTTTAQPHTCANGDVAVFRHNKWRCKDE